MFTKQSVTKWIVGPLALLATVLYTIDVADARRGGSFGSRGANTFSPPTRTQPAQATPPFKKPRPQPGAAAPAAPGAAAAATTAAASRFGGMGLMRGLILGGLMGALFASIFGAGALASMLGFLLQTLLIVAVVMLAISFFRNRAAGQAAAKPVPVRIDERLRRTSTGAGQDRSTAPQTAGTFAGAAAAAGTAAPLQELSLQDADFDAFERLLRNVQAAYSTEDMATLERITTPEVLSHFAHEIADNKRQGLENRVSDVSLLQGDLSEAWREADGEYATVAMRYSMRDALVNKATGEVVMGSLDSVEEVTEIWTFWRPRNGTAEQWELSAVQSV